MPLIISEQDNETLCVEIDWPSARSREPLALAIRTATDPILHATPGGWSATPHWFDPVSVQWADDRVGLICSIAVWDCVPHDDRPLVLIVRGESGDEVFRAPLVWDEHDVRELLHPKGTPSAARHGTTGQSAEPAGPEPEAPAAIAPVPLDIAVATLCDRPVTVDVCHASGVDPDQITGVWTGRPVAGGRVVVNADRTLSFDPKPGFIGQDRFVYGFGTSYGEGEGAGVEVAVAPVLRSASPPQRRTKSGRVFAAVAVLAVLVVAGASMARPSVWSQASAWMERAGVPPSTAAWVGRLDARFTGLREDLMALGDGIARLVVGMPASVYDGSAGKAAKVVPAAAAPSPGGVGAANPADVSAADKRPSDTLAPVTPTTIDQASKPGAEPTEPPLVPGASTVVPDVPPATGATDLMEPSAEVAPVDGAMAVAPADVGPDTVVNPPTGESPLPRAAAPAVGIREPAAVAKLDTEAEAVEPARPVVFRLELPRPLRPFSLGRLARAEPDGCRVARISELTADLRVTCEPGTVPPVTIVIPGLAPIETDGTDTSIGSMADLVTDVSLLLVGEWPVETFLGGLGELLVEVRQPLGPLVDQGYIIPALAEPRVPGCEAVWQPDLSDIIGRTQALRVVSPCQAPLITWPAAWGDGAVPHLPRCLAVEPTTVGAGGRDGAWCVVPASQDLADLTALWGLGWDRVRFGDGDQVLPFAAEEGLRAAWPFRPDAEAVTGFAGVRFVIGGLRYCRDDAATDCCPAKWLGRLTPGEPLPSVVTLGCDAALPLPRYLDLEMARAGDGAFFAETLALPPVAIADAGKVALPVGLFRTHAPLQVAGDPLDDGAMIRIVDQESACDASDPQTGIRFAYDGARVYENVMVEIGSGGWWAFAERDGRRVSDCVPLQQGLDEIGDAVFVFAVDPVPPPPPRRLLILTPASAYARGYLTAIRNGLREALAAIARTETVPAFTATGPDRAGAQIYWLDETAIPDGGRVSDAWLDGRLNELVLGQDEPLDLTAAERLVADQPFGAVMLLAEGPASVPDQDTMVTARRWIDGGKPLSLLTINDCGQWQERAQIPAEWCTDLAGMDRSAVTDAVADRVTGFLLAGN